jgi:hypothetical protein|tara:strand:- start:263 stop:649 length:387 start_codon:yes stop_codon:yes gene_type:complete
MKLNRKTLRKIILQEIRLLKESRQDHLDGITNKIKSLQAELERQEYAKENFLGSDYGYTQTEWDTIEYDELGSPEYNNIVSNISRLEDKLSVLYQQYEQLTSYDEDPQTGKDIAKTGPIGQLYRGDSW